MSGYLLCGGGRWREVVLAVFGVAEARVSLGLLLSWACPMYLDF